jgi:hypothetical protein
MTLIILTMIKNIGVIYLVARTSSVSKMEYAVLGISIMDTIFIEPGAFYCSYYLYQSMQATLTFKR